MNRSPAFQFYPDKWQSHTRRLSNESYRVYHELICWMWQQSDDYCSVEMNTSAIALLLVMHEQCICKALAEIQNKHAPLLREENGRYVSYGLKKEAEKQKLNREKKSAAANSRWSKKQPMQTQCTSNADAMQMVCSLSPSLSPSPTLSLSSKEEKENTPSSSSVKPKKKRNVLKLADDKLFLDELKGVYRPLGVDVDTQLARAKAWLLGPKGRGRKLTQQFFVNWLSRADVSISQDAEQPEISEENKAAVKRMNEIMEKTI